MSRANFLMVWVGDKYGPEYPAILHDMICRNVSNLDEWTVSCVTDHAPEELPEGVQYIPTNPDLKGWWQKLFLFSPGMPFEEGERLVYFDLDVAITGRLEDLVERKGIIQDWHWPMFNSSVMVWDHGEHGDIWRCFSLCPEAVHTPSPPEIGRLLPLGQINGGDQEFISYVSQTGDEPWDTFPPEWFVSYRAAAVWPPADCKAVIFHGAPKPHEVTEGWVPDVWKLNGFTALPVMSGVNTSHDHIRANIASAVRRDLPWFTGAPKTKRRCVIVGGAPSVRDCLSDIRWHALQGDQIISVNNSWRLLLENKIKPAINVMCDARPENAEFVKGAPDDMRFMIASQCDPAVFEALAGREVVVWHVGFGDNAMLIELLAPWWGEGPNQRPCILVPGGGTVFLRALWLAAFSGFKTIHAYGVDSSYADSGEHHAYAQPLNDGERIMEVIMRADGQEKRYRAAPWMVRQANEFKETWADLRKEGVRIHVHGRGLLPDIAANLKRASG